MQILQQEQSVWFQLRWKEIVTNRRRNLSHFVTMLSSRVVENLIHNLILYIV